MMRLLQSVFPVKYRALRTVSFAFAAVFVLSACEYLTVSGGESLEEWANKKKVEAQAAMPKDDLPEPAPFVPHVYSYGANTKQSPFDASQIPGFYRGSRKPDQAKSEFESISLDSINFVGTMIKSGKRWALIKLGSTIHPVQAGQKLGNNSGVISEINDAEIVIKESTLDEDGVLRPIYKTVQLKGGG